MILNLHMTAAEKGLRWCFCTAFHSIIICGMMLSPLLEDTFDLILPDLRGFGESTTVDSPYSMDDYASDIAGLLDHLGIQKAAIVGHSMGGYVALAFARLYPERVSGLGLGLFTGACRSSRRKEGRYKSAADVADKGIGSVVETMTSKFTSDARLQAFARAINGKATACCIYWRAQSNGRTSGFHSPAIIFQVSGGDRPW